MTKSVKIGYDESSKAVTAHVQITDDECNDPQALLQETTELFKQAQSKANALSMQKLV